VTDPESPVLTIAEKIDENAKETCGVTGTGDPAEAYGAPIFVRGGFNGWADPPPDEAMFMNFGGNDYQAEFEIDPGPWEFKVASADWSTDFTANGEVLIDTPVGLVPGGGAANSSVNLDAGGCFNFQLDVTDPAAPVLTLTEVPVIPTDEPVDLDLRGRIGALAAARQSYEALRRGTQTVVSAPGGACEPEETGNDPAEDFGVEMFARGSFNDWADPPPASDAFANVGGGVYEARVTLGSGDERYKVAAGDWSVEFAYIEAESGNTPLDAEVVLVPASGQGTEGQIAVAEAGCYLWRMNAADPAAPTLTISQDSAGSPTDVLAFQRDLEGAPSVVVVVNNEDDPVDLSGLGAGGIPVTLADGAVTEITGLETDLAVAGGVLTGTVPARSTLLVSDR
jgi:pullulanase